MEQQTVADFERGLLDILVRAMSRVAGLEGDDFFPSAIRETRARVWRGSRGYSQKGAARDLLDQRDSPARGSTAASPIDVLGPRMRLLGGAEHRFGLALAIDAIDLGELSVSRAAVPSSVASATS